MAEGGYVLASCKFGVRDVGFEHELDRKFKMKSPFLPRSKK